MNPVDGVFQMSEIGNETASLELVRVKIEAPTGVWDVCRTLIIKF